MCRPCFSRGGSAAQSVSAIVPIPLRCLSEVELFILLLRVLKARKETSSLLSPAAASRGFRHQSDSLRDRWSKLSSGSLSAVCFPS